MIFPVRQKEIPVKSKNSGLSCREFGCKLLQYTKSEIARAKYAVVSRFDGNSGGAEGVDGLGRGGTGKVRAAAAISTAA